jgi:hypothetical protein
VTQDEQVVLNAIRTFAAGSRLTRQSVSIAARLPDARLDKALDGLETSGHIWRIDDRIRLSSDGTTFDT